MDSLRDLWNELDVVVTRMVVVIAILLAAFIIRRILALLLRRAYWRRLDAAAARRDAQQLTRIKRQKTLVTLLESLVRYAVYGVAAVIALGLISGGKSSALFGASLVVVLVGFGFQRLLGDVVAGALLLFEGHFAVGDVITVHTQNVTGTVEEFTLRTTALRTLGGDRVTIMNGNLVSFTRWSYGQREFRIELLVRGEHGVEQATATCASEAGSSTALWVRPPRVEHVEQLSGTTIARVTVSVVVAPGQEALVERLCELLDGVLTDAETLVGPVSSLPLYQPVYEEWRAGVLVRE